MKVFCVCKHGNHEDVKDGDNEGLARRQSPTTNNPPTTTNYRAQQI